MSVNTSEVRKKAEEDSLGGDAVETLCCEIDTLRGECEDFRAYVRNVVQWHDRSGRHSMSSIDLIKQGNILLSASVVAAVAPRPEPTAEQYEEARGIVNQIMDGGMDVVLYLASILAERDLKIEELKK